MHKKLSYSELEDKVIEIREELAFKIDEVNRLKSSFLSNVSHEIRTPMNVIMGFSNLLSDPRYNQDQKNFFVDEINKNSKELLRLIDNIILTAKVETGNIKLNMTFCDIQNIMDELYNHFHKNINNHKKRNVKINLITKLNNQDNKVFTDSLKLKHALFNLIENAIKFTINGLVEFGYEVNDENDIEFFVKDTGIGINGKDINKIFKKFTQLEEDDTRKDSGLGIGLTISDRLIQLLGGKLIVKSTLGKGSSFYFTIPLLVEKPA